MATPGNNEGQPSEHSESEDRRYEDRRYEDPRYDLPELEDYGVGSGRLFLQIGPQGYALIEAALENDDDDDDDYMDDDHDYEPEQSVEAIHQHDVFRQSQLYPSKYSCRIYASGSLRPVHTDTSSGAMVCFCQRRIGFPRLVGPQAPVP